MTVVTRFAPSPTGFLHIGGARTALFNWLYARHHGGRYLLRIEDTDRARSTPAAVEAILDGLSWLGLDWDGDVIYQFERAARHAEVAKQMLAAGTAYHCYASPQELEEMRNEQRRAGVPMRYDGRWRDRDPKDAPPGVAPVIRLKAPQSGKTVIQDAVQGEVTVDNAQLDDMILLRADGTPTYMHAVVVDDHDMGITHVIRGDDHLTNAARQIPIFQAMGWTPPKFAHVPLIHGEDGKKLSKRHGAQAVHEWREMGYLPEGMTAYLMRLGWSPGHDDILTKEEAAQVFELGQIGRAPSRLDFKKLDSVNAHFMALADDDRLTELLIAHLEAKSGAPLSEAQSVVLGRAVPVLKKRAKTLLELADQAAFLLAQRPLVLDPAAKSHMKDEFSQRLARLRERLAAAPEWEHAELSSVLKAFATDEGVGLGQIGPGLRAALSGGSPSPDLGQTLELLGRDEALARIADQI